ncbi:hypothetical protein K445DRAFT_320919 [Daldinia sp. EC12]|nr:hypothetical protein K445DRAFT_320919 [Daldinia sp. EC12]
MSIGKMPTNIHPVSHYSQNCSRCGHTTPHLFLADKSPMSCIHHFKPLRMRSPHHHKSLSAT